MDCAWGTTRKAAEARHGLTTLIPAPITRSVRRIRLPSPNSNGYVVGQDGGGTKGFIWSQGSGYSTIPSLNFAWGISQNSQLVAGENQSGKAAVYSTSFQTVSSTYWSGEATFVNDSGLVVGDTNSGFYYYGYDARAMAEIDGQQVDFATAYAPAGVTFNYCEGVNDAGQILVWSDGSSNLQTRTSS